MMHVHIRDNINGMIRLSRPGNIVTIHFDSCLNMIPEGKGRKGLVCVYVDNVPLQNMPSLVKSDLVAIEQKIKS